MGDELTTASGPFGPAAGNCAVERRECHCEDCDRDYVTWFAPNELWNAVMRPHGEVGGEPFLCASCFALRADAAGVEHTGFLLTTETQFEQAKAEADYNAAAELLRIGDNMQSSLSRLAEFASSVTNAPYEVAMAALEADSAVDEWTALRMLAATAGLATANPAKGTKVPVAHRTNTPDQREA